MGRLYIVATPIGNLGDISYRAVETLRACAAAFCEDTRHSRKLLNHLDIPIPTFSCRGQNSGACVPRMLQMLEQGADIAYLSDAGTPAISDPGSAMVRSAREEGHAVVPIPGASAVSALLSVAGIAGRGWFFEGFLSPKGARRTRRLEELVARGDPFVLYESPHRIGKLAGELAAVAGDWQVVVGRELTKLYEQILALSVADLANLLENGTIPARGEFAILVWSGKSR